MTNAAAINVATGPIIEFDAVVAGYSPSLTILDRTTLDARAGEITLLIGPNGAGKSTVLKTLFGMLVPRAGEVRFEGRRINGMPPRELLRKGIAFVPQGRNLFGSLSVRHNLELGGITLPRGELGPRIAEVLARFPRIAERIDNQASTLSGANCSDNAGSEVMAVRSFRTASAPLPRASRSRKDARCSFARACF